MLRQLKEVQEFKEVRRRKNFEEKFSDYLKTALKEGKLGDENSFKAISKVVKMMFIESAIEEALEKVLPKANVSNKRRLYGSPDKALGLFTVITSHNKPVGYFVDLSLAKEFGKSSDLLAVLTVLNTLALEAYKLNICKEANHGIKFGAVSLPAVKPSD